MDDDTPYWQRVHQRALRDARHALSLETPQRVVRLVLGTIIIVGFVVWIASLTGVTNDLLSKVLTALSTTVAVAVILLVVFYVWNFVQAPARLDREAVAKIGELQLKVEDQAARRKVRNELWQLRNEGVQLRNRGNTTSDTVAWKQDFDNWHRRVLAQSIELSADLRHVLDPLDKISPDNQEAVQVSDTQHRLEVSVLSEMLSRLYKFLSETAIQDGRHP